MTTTKTWTVEEIKNLLKVNKTMVQRSLIKIYEFQTADEKMSGETTHHNGVGFNGVDAGFMSNCAEFYIRTGFLTERQFSVVQKKLYKYAGQLARIANGEL